MLRFLFSIVLLILFVCVGIWGWLQRGVVGSFLTQFVEPVQTQYLAVSTDLRSQIQPMQGVAQGVSDQIEPTLDLFRDFAPIINLFASQSGVVIDPNAQLDLQQISSLLETVPSEYAQQALYGYCKQIVTEYEQRNLVE